MTPVGGASGSTPLNPDELEGLKFTHVQSKGELDRLEQANITKGIAWLNSLRNPHVLSEKFVRELHRRLFGDVWTWAGKFRATGKNIGVDPAVISVELKKLLDDLHFWIEKATYAPKEAAFRFHHRLVQIHLFPNGNGRHARIMADALLQKVYKESPIDWAGGHELGDMSQRRKAYIAALKAADHHDFKLLLEFIQ